MSFWILTYVNIYESYDTEPTGLYKTEDEAINECIIDFYGDELYETPDGKIWIHLEEFVGLPIELKELRKRIKKYGFLDKEDAWNDDLSDCKQYFIITKMGVTKNSKMTTRKTKLLTEQHKCKNCKENFSIHLFEKPTVLEPSPDHTKCRNCHSSGILCYEYSDKWYCSDICKKSKHAQLSSEKQNKELRQPGKNFHCPPGGKQKLSLNVRHYGNRDGGKRKVCRSSNGIILITKNDKIIAIGSDIESDGSLKMMSMIKDSPLLKELEIDEGWRKGNEKPVLFSDYLKMTSQEN